jgi:hypothetical protein
LTTAINPCQGFSVIADVVETGNKFIFGVTDTGEQLSSVTTTLAINLSPVTMTPVNTGVVVTSDKFISGDKNKDVMELGSCQG